MFSDHTKSPYAEMAQMAADMLNLSPEVLPFSKVNIIVKRFRETPNAIVQSVCQVLRKGVSGIIVSASSHNVQQVADTACQYNIPVIAPTATSINLTQFSLLSCSARGARENCGKSIGLTVSTLYSCLAAQSVHSPLISAQAR
eukprot:sb/3474102/